MNRIYSIRLSNLLHKMVVIFVFCFVADCFAQVAFPKLTIIGQKFGNEQVLWQGLNSEKKTLSLPRQVAIDYTPQGDIYGLTCEYLLSTNNVSELKARIQDELKVLPKVENDKMSLWRSEERKMTIILEQDRETEILRLIVVSIDKTIRKQI
jgi:hypothetical protein